MDQTDFEKGIDEGRRRAVAMMRKYADYDNDEAAEAMDGLHGQDCLAYVAGLIEKGLE